MFWGCVQESFVGERHERPVHDPVPRYHDVHGPDVQV